MQIQEYQKVLDKTYNAICLEKNEGEVAGYIPELSKINPDKLGACILTTEGESYGLGDYQERFSIQSISKVFSLTLIYSIMGKSVWERVGIEPSGTAFNSLVQLENDHGIPRNPFINAGAIVICDMLISKLDDPKASFINFVRKISQNDTIDYSPDIVKSEASVGYTNKALCYYIKSYGNIVNNPEQVLDFYFHICSIKMTCQELAQAFMYLAKSDFTINNERILSISRTKRINAVMQTCGFYDESGEFAFTVGLPGKSGVGGGIVALHPDKYTIAVWSPKLNKKGNSYRGMKFLELFTTTSGLSVF